MIKKSPFSTFFRVAVLLATVVMIGSFNLFAGSNKPKVSLRVHVQVDKGQIRAIPVELSNPQRVFYVSQFAEVTEKDIDSVHIYRGPFSLGAKVQLGAHGRLALETATTKSNGRLWVIFVNNRPVFIDVIDSPIKDGIIHFENISPEEAEDLIKEYNKK